MASPPISIKLRCSSWNQLAAIYERDLKRSAVFLKSAAPPPVGTRVRINLTLPTQTLIILNGTIETHVGPGELNGRGPGVDIRLHSVPQSALWIIESALDAARRKEASAPQPASDGQEAADSEDASLEAGKDVVAAEDELVTALSQELESLRKLNPFQVLGIGYEASDAELQTAFAALTKRYHPDRFARYESGEARKLAAEIFILVRDAYQRLEDVDARAKVSATLGQRRAMRSAATAVPPRPPPTPPPTPPPPAQPDAPEPEAPEATPPVETRPHRAPTDASTGAETGPAAYRKATLLLDQGQYPEAVALFRLAARKNPGDHAAKVGLELAEGLKALAERDRLEAAQRFEAVLEMDPDNERAARELGEMRRQATNKRKGHLSRLMKQKG